MSSTVPRNVLYSPGTGGHCASASVFPTILNLRKGRVSVIALVFLQSGLGINHPTLPVECQGNLRNQISPNSSLLPGSCPVHSKAEQALFSTMHALGSNQNHNPGQEGHFESTLKEIKKKKALFLLTFPHSDSC